MKVFYHPGYNFELGLLARLHPFDGRKFQKVYAQIQGLAGLELAAPNAPISQAVIDSFVSPLTKELLGVKRVILEALEVPYLPLVPFSFIDKRILEPMRWGVAGTLAAAKEALKGCDTWNLAGGYHHASRHSTEGFCIYNDIGIAQAELLRENLISPDDRIAIIDVDAHHGNGNAATFADNPDVTILDVYNAEIYPRTRSTKLRVDISVPLPNGTGGPRYLDALAQALRELQPGFRYAYVVAGTDVLASDKLGGFKLTVAECAERDRMVLARLNELSIPAIFLGGGGYSSASATAISESLRQIASASAAA